MKPDGQGPGAETLRDALSIVVFYTEYLVTKIHLPIDGRARYTLRDRVGAVSRAISQSQLRARAPLTTETNVNFSPVAGGESLVS